MQTFSVRECLSFGWNTFKSRAWFFISSAAVMLLLTLIVSGPRLGNGHSQSKAEVITKSVLYLASLFLSFLLTMGKTAFYLKGHDHTEEVTLHSLWHPHPYWKFVAASLLTGILTVIGFLLLIVPGIIIGIILSFTPYIVIDTGIGPIEAMKESVRITKGHKWQLFLLGAALLGINILGFCVVLLGLLVSIPVSVLALVHAYRTLKGSAVAPVIDSVIEPTV